MNKLHKCLYIVNLFKDRGRLSRQEIETALCSRYPSEPTLSDSTFKRYMHFIEESFSCFIEYDRSSQTYSMRYAKNLSPKIKETIDELLENERRSDQSEQEDAPFEYNSKTMMLMAVRRRDGKLVASPFLAQTMDEGIQKANAFYGETLVGVSVVTKREYGKDALTFPLEVTKPIWTKGQPLVANTYLVRDFKRLLDDASNKQQYLKRDLEAGVIDTRKEFENWLQDQNNKDILELCQDDEKLNLCHEVFNLGILSTYSILENKGIQTYLTDTKEAFSFCLVTMEKLGKNFHKLLMLLMVERDSVLRIFITGMLFASHINENH